MDMMSLLNDYDESRIDSRYRLVILSAQRARQMMQGSKALVTSKFAKETTVALDEVLQGRTEFVTGKEAKTAMKEAILARELEERARAKAKAALPREDESEIRKDLTVYVNDKDKEGQGIHEVEPGP